MEEDIRYFKSKAVAIKHCKDNFILANRQLSKYCVLNGYDQFVSLIENSTTKDYYEYISNKVPVCFFFDIEIYKDTSPHYYSNPNEIVSMCFDKVKSILPEQTTIKFIVLESHQHEIKKSFHIITRAIDKDDNEIMFENVAALKTLIKSFGFDKIKDTKKRHLIDPSVYREGLFRTIHSSKKDENRPLIKCHQYTTHSFTDIETFVCYKSNNYVIFGEAQSITHENISIEINEPEIVNVPQDLSEDDKKIIVKFVEDKFHQLPNKVRDIIVNEALNCIIVSLTEKYCQFVVKEHRNNFQYIIIDTSSAKQKCHNTECNEHKYNEVKLEQYPKEINQIIKKCLKVSHQELVLIDKAIEECKNYITENFDHDVKDVSFDSKEMIFRGNVVDRSLSKILKGKCPECNVEHQISDTGYCLKCKTCNSIFPKNQIIPVDSRYKNLNNFWLNYTQLVNHGTINNIINIYNGGDLEFSCDIKLDQNIFKNKEITSIVNQVLDGHKVTMISKLVHTIDKKFIYSRNNWYYFTNSIWKSDSDNLEMKKEIIDLSRLFDRIKSHYDVQNTDESTMTLNKNIKSLINKFHKPGFQDDIIKGAKIYYNDESFITKLNSKKHLVPFTNGVYDLLENKFRKTKKEDYVNLTTNFDFDPKMHNQEVYTFLEQVLPNPGVRDFVLKKMSECLNGDIPNTYFLMFIGDSGANGKSQLLNLMKLTMGDFGEKVEVTLLTRKRNNANEANCEKVKLMNKRFAFLSEPEDGEKINIGLLKELTGSEEIVARGLYQDSLSFVMEAKLFLACNELPEIKGEDVALWRRIRVVDFPSKFVDEPSEPGEFPIDRTLPSRMREDPTWRQTFMNILLSYYTRIVPEPIEVKMKTNEYRQENNDFYNWLEENVEENEDELLQLKTICEMYLNKTSKIHSSLTTKYKKEVEKYVKEKYKLLKWEHGVVRINNISYNGWKHLSIKS